MGTLRASLIAASSVWIVSAAPASRAAEKTLYGLPCYPGPGNSLGALAFDAAGNLFGTASTGGVAQSGAVFEMIAPAPGRKRWKPETLYGFGTQTGMPPPADAGGPQSGVLVLKNGKLVGTGFDGGGTGCGGNGCGAVYLMTPPKHPQKAWPEQVIYDFPGGGDGANPAAGLIADRHGNYYGTTEYGGTGQAGTAFELAPPAGHGSAWTESPIYAFTNGADGGFPTAPLVIDANGALYGTAPDSANGAGTVFRLTPPAQPGQPWTETTLYAFGVSGAPTDGDQPEGGLIFDARGNLYGTTLFGGAYGRGIVFELSPPAAGQTVWTESTLYSFQDNGDGALPGGPLLLNDHKIYGTAQGSGRGASDGVVFRLAPPHGGGTTWAEKMLHAFTGGADGEYPLGGVVTDGGGDFYGTTAFGGVSGCGTVFKVTP
jgi:uncharacterized repeat protein (TIGR03803 family)